jgi:succinoglycan biosynthesis transport protein ExoP
MDLMRYARVLRAHWLLIVVAMLLCILAADVIVMRRQPIYAAHSQLFVSVASTPAKLTPSETYQGGLFSQQRVESYANIVSSPRVAQAVISQLSLSRSVPEVQSRIHASVVPGTVLIDVTVKDQSPALAKAIADAVAQRFPGFVNELESSDPGRSPVKVSVTSPARLPTTPLSSSTAAYLILGALLGAILGVGAAVLREIFDKRIRYDEDAEAVADAPILGHIPQDRYANARPLVVVDDPDSAAAEAYRRLRTNLRVLSADHGLRSLVVSSAVAGEGKTLIVANLGVAFAQAGAVVVLVDADMRRPRLAHVLGLQPTLGLSDVLTRDDVPLEMALHRHDTLPLEVLGSGATPPNPSDLLGSDRCEALLRTLASRADIVIFDTPAMVPVSDAVMLARPASGLVLVARVPATRAEELDRAADSLRSVGKRPLGVILNGVPARGDWPYANGARATDRGLLETGMVWHQGAGAAVKRRRAGSGSGRRGRAPQRAPGTHPPAGG